MEEIIIIDDDKSITETIAEILHDAFGEDYPIKEFNDPEKAYTYYQEHGPSRMILLDLSMPKITGEKLTLMLTSIHKEQAITIITGKHNRAAEKKLIAQCLHCQILRKPFTIEELLELF